MKKLLAVLLTLFLCACPPPTSGGEPGTIIEIIRTTEFTNQYSQQSAIVVVRRENGFCVEYPIRDVNLVNNAGLKVGQQVLCSGGTLRVVTSREVETEK